MSRARFTAPIGDVADPAFTDLLIAAAKSDTADVVPTAVDWAYWRGIMPVLFARGLEVHYGGDDPGAAIRYAWDRLIGWQAGGDDVPPYGPYANPPNVGPAGGWTTPLVDVGPIDPPVAPPVPPPAPDVVTLVLTTLARLEDKVDALMVQQNQNTEGIHLHINQVVEDLEQTVANYLPLLEALVGKLRP